MTDFKKKRTLADIQKKIDSGDVVVFTAREVADLVRKGTPPEFSKIDVVTTATSAVMSGTYAVLSFKVTEPDIFSTAVNAWINSVPACVGPCPNERIGIIDLIVLGTARSIDNPEYGGGHLFRDLVQGNTVQVKFETDDGRFLTAETCLKEIPHAMLHASRNAFKNYLAFVNPGMHPVKTIFHAGTMGGNYEEMTFCGCGEINPIENDPELKTIGIGSRVMINGAPGMVTGAGTRSTADKPNLTGTADMHEMKAEYMGGFSTGHGPDVVTTWAIAIPVLSEEMLTHILKTDDQIPLNVVDVRSRKPIHEITYEHVWKQSYRRIEYRSEKCRTCSGHSCKVEKYCPSGAAKRDAGQVIQIDPERCFNCGYCLSMCHGEAFVGELGTVSLDQVEVPISLRQSDRVTALQASQDLKKRVIEKRFRLNQPVAQIQFQEHS